MGFEADTAGVALAVVAVLVLAAALVWHARGWTAFSLGPGENPGWTPAAGKTPAALRFRRATYSVTRGDGVVQTRDVTGVLNAMAQGLAGLAPGAAPASLELAAGLNEFSFVLAGFNTPEVASLDPGPWTRGGVGIPAKAVALSGEVRTI